MLSHLSTSELRWSSFVLGGAVQLAYTDGLDLRHSLVERQMVADLAFVVGFTLVDAVFQDMYLFPLGLFLLLELYTKFL